MNYDAIFADGADQLVPEGDPSARTAEVTEYDDSGPEIGRTYATLDSPASIAPLGPRLADALRYALEAHAGQSRKGGTAIPYIAHPLAVCSLVLEYGGSEDEAIAALLHDVVEDTENGEERLVEMREMFGPRVGRIVLLCSDATVTPKPDYAIRKRNYIERVRAHVTAPNTDVGYLRVSCADKLHNARSILSDFALIGNEVFDRFSAPTIEGTLDYYGDLADAFGQYRGDNSMQLLAEELDKTVRDLQAAVDEWASR